MLRGGLLRCPGGNLLGLVILIISYKEASGGTVCAGDDLLEFVSGVIDKIGGLVVLVQGDQRILTSEDLVDFHWVGEPGGDEDGHLVDNQREPEEDPYRTSGIQFEKLPCL